MGGGCAVDLQEIHSAFDSAEYRRVIQLAESFTHKTGTHGSEILYACREGHKAAILLSDGPTAQRFADQMLRLSTGNLIWKAEAHYRKGVAEWWCGDFASALEHYRQYLMRANSLPDPFAHYVGPAHYNMALAYRSQHQYEKALDHLQQALQFFEVGHFFWWQARLDLIWTYIKNDNLLLAGALLNECNGLELSEDLWLRWEYLTNRALYLLQQDLLGEADHLCELLMRDADAHHKGHASCIQGTVAVQTGNYQAAQTALSMALSMADQTKDPAIIEGVFHLNRLMQQATSEKNREGREVVC